MKTVMRILSVLLILSLLTGCTAIRRIVGGGESPSSAVSGTVSSANSSSEGASSGKSVRPAESSSKSDAGETSQASSETHPTVSVGVSSSESSSSESSSSESSTPASSSEASASSSEPTEQPFNDNARYTFSLSAGQYQAEYGGDTVYLHLICEFGRIMAFVGRYYGGDSLYSFYGLDLFPVSVQEDIYHFDMKSYSVQSAWDTYGDSAQLDIRITQNGLTVDSSAENVFPKGITEFTRTSSAPKTFPYTTEELQNFLPGPAGDTSGAEALFGEWVAFTEGSDVIRELSIGSDHVLKALISDSDDNTPYRYLEGVYIGMTGPGAIAFYYLGNCLGAGNMPTSGEITIALMDEDTIQLTAEGEDFLTGNGTVTYHRAPYAP